VRSQSVRDGIRSLRKALLVLHSPVDDLVPVEEAERIYTSALHPKSFISLDNADHLLSRKADSRYAGHVLAAWARRKRLPLESVRVDVQHGKIHAKDCMDCESESGKIDGFEKLIHLEGKLSPEQRERMLEIADRCPVHRTLKGEVNIV